MGAAIFVCHQILHCSVTASALTLHAKLGLLHSLTVPGMLRKIVGVRLLTVPFYLAITVANMFNALSLLWEPSYGHAMALWGSMSAFLWVRYFYFIFEVLSGGLDEKAVYTLATGLGGLFGIQFQMHPLWLVNIASPVVFAPLMVLVHRVHLRLEFMNMPKPVMTLLTVVHEALHPFNAHGREADVRVGSADVPETVMLHESSECLYTRTLQWFRPPPRVQIAVECPGRCCVHVCSKTKNCDT